MREKSVMMKSTFLAILLTMAISVNAFGANKNSFHAISSKQAFDARVKQIDPLTHKASKVALVDIRSAAEYYWVGAPAKVDMIVTSSGEELKPYLGKALNVNGDITFATKSGDKLKSIILTSSEISEIFTDPIAINIPFENWNESERKLVQNKNFKAEIEVLSNKYDVLIIMCRSGKRTSKCDFDSSLFKAVYELDGLKNGRGGFQGSSYEDIYNGYRGWPGRKSPSGNNESVSWIDTGLPIHIGWSK
jgi:rhodanese-related sulfurtransferase